jgi:hypothetical protein
LPPYAAYGSQTQSIVRNNRVAHADDDRIGHGLSVTPEGAYDFAVVVPDIHNQRH